MKRRTRLTEEDVRSVERLARLTLDKTARERMRKDLEKILDYFSAIDEVDTTDVEPMSHGSDLGNVLREDLPAPSLPAEEALKNAPRRRDDYFEVPRVL